MQRPLPLHGAMPEPMSRPRSALAAKGFRPFFLMAAAFATVIIPIWLLVVFGHLATGPYLEPTSWHAHEMVFGFTVAVIAGFLLTAVGNWTQRETAIGVPLFALAALWAAGRVVMILASVLPRGVVAAVDLAFLPALFVALARPLVASKNRRNFVMLAVIAGLFAANVVVHLEAFGVLALGAARRACLTAIDVVVFLILVITGRVLPMFTRNATGATTRSRPALETATAIGMAALVAIDAVAPETTLAAGSSAVVGVVAIARAAQWGTRHTARHPLLWVLHVGYAWVPVGLLLRAGRLVGLPVWSSLATHALTVGAIGMLTLGMMARVSLGHTGRPLVAPRTAAWAFAAIAGASIARVLVPLFELRWHVVALVAAGSLWTTAFVLYLVGYAPMLVSPRVDGKAG